jgi:hypothetical protein
MDRVTQQGDILRVLDFTEKLLEFLLTLVPPTRSQEYTSVWESEVRPKLRGVRSEIQQIPVSSPQWNRIDDIGWSPESARLKADSLAEQAGKGALATTIRLTNSALGSLKIVFLGLEPPKEFKDYLETWAENQAEPEPFITTLFGPGPIPGPSSGVPPSPGRKFRVPPEPGGRKFR